ncbi:MAG TPA: IS4 family transposase [Ktedonobacteraceae bacterium]|nr:IS4 family transposase [Ktedonobacteraceae bacterium]
MTSIPRVSRRVKHLFEQDAVELARQAGLRQRTLNFTQLALILVLGWWKQPDAGPSALARFAGSLGVRLEKQTLDCHFTERTATWLLALLRRAVQHLVWGPAIKVPLLQHFSAVYVEDGSSIHLPDVLQSVWKGCGGRGSATAAGLKVTLRWDLRHGCLQGPSLQAGRCHELASVLQQQVMAPGSLWIADLGYWTLKWLRGLSQQGVFFLMRYKPGIILWQGKERLDLLEVLPSVVGERLELLVDVGANKVLRGVRLLAERVPAEVADQRQQRLREYAREHGKAANPLVLELAHWTIIVTNVPASRLTIEQALALLRARWQIELLFKLWKQHALLDEWKASSPWRILCEVYAKLLAMVVQHWFVLLSCWDDPYHSLPGVAEVLREQVPTLVHGLRGHLSLTRAIRLMTQSVRGGCSIPKRSTRESTSARLLSVSEPLLT